MVVSDMEFLVNYEYIMLKKVLSIKILNFLKNCGLSALTKKIICSPHFCYTTKCLGINHVVPPQNMLKVD